MIEGTGISTTVFALFLASTNAYVGKLSELADAIAAEDPDTAARLTSFGQTVAGRAVDLVQRWPSEIGPERARRVGRSA